MREFMILIGELILVAAMQNVVEAIFTEWKIESRMKIINIACLLISYFLLLRFVYNHFIEEITALVNFAL